MTDQCLSIQEDCSQMETANNDYELNKESETTPTQNKLHEFPNNQHNHIKQLTVQESTKMARINPVKHSKLLLSQSSNATKTGFNTNDMLNVASTSQSNKRPCLDSSVQNSFVPTVPVHNRFQVLTNHDDIREVENVPKDSKVKIPPICLHNIANYQLLIQHIHNHVKSEFHTELKGSTIKVYSSTTDDFRALTSYFDSIKQQYFTYKNPADKKFGVIIRNLPYSLGEQEIKDALQELKYPVHKVTRLLGRNKQPTPLCAVELEENDKGKSILNLTRLLYSVIKVEIRRKSKEIPQCNRCQNYGHTKNYCQLQPRCVRCLEAHHFSECPKPKTNPPKCVNCHEEHPANYRGCRHYLQLKERLSQSHNNSRLGQQQPTVRTSRATPSSSACLPQQSTSQGNTEQRHQQQPSSRQSSGLSHRSFADAVNNSVFNESQPSIPPPSDSTVSSFLGDLLNRMIPHIISFINSQLPTIQQFVISLLSSTFQNGST